MAESWPPTGVRFFPTDDVLITHYLESHIHGHPLPVPGAIIEADVYGQHAVPSNLFQSPDAIWQTRVDSCGKLTTTESVRYVFTRLSKVGKGTGTKQRSRVAAGGSCWHGNTSVDVINEYGNKVGTKRTFKFKGGNNVHLPTDAVFIMHEYSTHFSEEFVLCKIKMIKREKRKCGEIDSGLDQGKKSRSDHQLAADLEQGNYIDPIIPAPTHQNVQESEKPDSVQNQLEDMDLQNFFMDALY